MIHETINLKDYFKTLENDAYLTSFCQDNFNEWSLNEKRKCLLILPGGGYEFVSERENEPVALRFCGYNIACFSLKYTIGSITKSLGSTSLIVVPLVIVSNITSSVT